MKISTAEIEERLKNELGLEVEVETADRGLLVTGIVATAEERELALEFVRSLAEDVPVADIVDVGGPGRPGVDLAIREAGDFTDQATLLSPDEAAGPTGTLEDTAGDGDRVYVPPTDPVASNTEVINGFASSSDDRSAPRNPEGELLADAVREALRLDSLTTGFPIEVAVSGDEVTLTGVVGDLEDVEYVEGLVGAVPGVGGVRERLTVNTTPHDHGERRPGEPASAGVMLDAKSSPVRRGQAPTTPAVAAAPNDEHSGGGRPYGSDDVRLAWTRSRARDWDELLGWLEHGTGLADAARAGMLDDFRALRDAGVPVPPDPGAAFDSAMIARTEDPGRAGAISSGSRKTRAGR